jgi:hypothetical protein
MNAGVVIVECAAEKSGLNPRRLRHHAHNIAKYAWLVAFRNKCCRDLRYLLGNYVLRNLHTRYLIDVDWLRYERRHQYSCVAHGYKVRTLQFAGIFRDLRHVVAVRGHCDCSLSKAAKKRRRLTKGE